MNKRLLILVWFQLSLEHKRLNISNIFVWSFRLDTSYLYEGRRDRISLRFWESVTLSTDSWESSLSAMVEIWNKQINQAEMRHTNLTSLYLHCG